MVGERGTIDVMASSLVLNIKGRGVERNASVKFRMKQGNTRARFYFVRWYTLTSPRGNKINRGHLCLTDELTEHSSAMVMSHVCSI